MPRIASAEAKWNTDNVIYRNAPELFPDDIPEAIANAIQEAAVEAFRALKLRDYGRIDMRMRLRKKKCRKRAGSSGDGRSDIAGEQALNGWEFYVIEANPNA